MSASRNRRITSRRLRAALITLTVALLLAAGPASAAAGTGFSSSGGDTAASIPSDQSAGDQYVETLPTTKGPRAPGRGKRAKRLSRRVANKIQKLGGSDAAALETLASSTTLGAPDAGGASKGSGGRGSKGHASRSGKRHGSSTPAVPSAAINAVDGGEAGLGWLVLAILAISALALGAVGYQRRRDKDSAA
jgi:hypothetical protein